FFGSPIENVRLMGGASYIEPEVTKTAIQSNEGNMAVGVPKTQGKLGVEWDNEVAQGVLTLSSNATAVSKQYIDQENTLHIPGRTLIDVGARYKTSISNHPIAFKADINNLMN
ncbi:TonB-dependent receptor domain-containing protein, partial [Acinetobacter baumannii]